jgi:hypothetical protein
MDSNSINDLDMVLLDLVINMDLDIAHGWSQIGLVDPIDWTHDVDDSLENAILSHEQMHIDNIICSKINGLHVIHNKCNIMVIIF